MSYFKFFFLFSFFQHILILSQITKSEHATSGVFLAYHNEITSMPQSVNNSYIETFGGNFSTVPIVVAGINDYKMFDYFYYQNFQFHIHSKSQTNFQIYAQPLGSTNIRKFSVSYLAIQDLYLNMFYFQKSYDNKGNIYLGSGNRSATIIQNFTLDSSGELFNINLSENRIIPITMGFFIQSNTVYNVQLSSLILDINRYQIQLFAYGDCLLQSVRVGVLLIVNITLFSNNDVYFDFGYKTISPNDTTWIYQQLPNVDFIFGLINFYSSDVSTSKLTLKWTQNSTNIQIALSHLQIATYLYIVYGNGHIIPNVVTSPNSFPIGAVIVPIVIIVLIGVGICVYKKYFSLDKSSRQLKINQSDQFLPEFF